MVNATSRLSQPCWVHITGSWQCMASTALVRPYALLTRLWCTLSGSMHGGPALEMHRKILCACKMPTFGAQDKKLAWSPASCKTFCRAYATSAMIPPSQTTRSDTWRLRSCPTNGKTERCDEEQTDKAASGPTRDFPVETCNVLQQLRVQSCSAMHCA